ncbi:hypothetical protein ACWCZ5_34830 [Streptomyces sp. NPDC001667]
MSAPAPLLHCTVEAAPQEPGPSRSTPTELITGRFGKVSVTLRPTTGTRTAAVWCASVSITFPLGDDAEQLTAARDVPGSIQTTVTSDTPGGWDLASARPTPPGSYTLTFTPYNPALITDNSEPVVITLTRILINNTPGNTELTVTAETLPASPNTTYPPTTPRAYTPETTPQRLTKISPPPTTANNTTHLTP